MTKKLGPYVGVTGFMSQVEVGEALSMIPQEAVHRLMVGVLVGFNTLHGNPNKWPGRYPNKETISTIFTGDQRALNLVHYSTTNKDELFDQLAEITALAGPHLDGFQLNVNWPSPLQLEKWRKAHPEQYMVFAIGGRAMDKVTSTEHFQELIGVYLPFIDAVLIDPSGGKGELLNVAKISEYLRVLSIYPELGKVVAGGLGPNTVGAIDSLIEEFPGISVDAEGQLRTPHPEDALQINSMRIYLDKSFRMLELKRRT